MNTYYHRSLAASPAYSEVGGLGSLQIIKGDPINITVKAKDSAGNYIFTGGELFMIKISNLWTKKNDHYCSPDGNSSPLTSNVNDIMVDHNDGNYTYSYTAPFTSKICLLKLFSWINICSDIFTNTKQCLLRILSR